MTGRQACRRVGNLAQLGGTRRYVLDDGQSKGVAAVEVDTGTGFRFTVLPDRGMDLSRADYRGSNLVYLTSNGEVHPAYYEARGSGWLRVFFGGLLTTCGLTHLGPPVRDGAEELGLHGRHTALPARQVCDRSHWEGDDYVIEVTGVIEDAQVFGPKLRLTRHIRSAIGRRGLTIHDEVENFGVAPCPFTILYHVNVGYPLLDETGELLLSAESTSAADDHSRKDLAAARAFGPPRPDFVERNYQHALIPDADGYVQVGFVNRALDGGVGLTLRYRKDLLPYFNEWKMLGEGDYVVGIEPANVPCLDRVALRERGLLPMLAPGETRTIELEIGILDGPGEIDDFAEARRAGKED